MRQPDYKMVQGGNYQVHQNPNVAGSVGKGLARMGQDMQRSGMQIAGALDKLAKSEEDREAITYQQEWENAYSEHKKTMLSTQHNPLEWQSKWDDISAKLRQGYETKSMSVRQRNRLGETFTRWNGEVSRSIGWNAHKTSYSNTRDTYTARAYNQAQDNNYDGSLETLSQAYQNGYMSQAEFEKGVGDIERKKKEYDIREEIATNPWDADLEKFNLNTQQKERWDGELKRSQSAKRREIGHDIVNGVISGDIDSEEKLREAASRMDEKSVFDLVKFYNGFHDDKVRKHMASPEQQNILVGKMKAMIAGYEPTGQAADEQYVFLMTQMKYLNEGARKKDLERQINAIRDGKEIEIKSVKEWGSKKITAHGKKLLDKIAKPEARQTKLLEYLNDGFFNEENLSVYFNEDDVENILDAKEKAGDIIGADNVSTYSARIEMFKKLWARRENVGNTEWEQRMANAIVAGGLNTVIREWDAPEDGAEYDAKVEAHEERLGRMHDEYQDFLKSHPDPQEKDIKDFLIDLEVDMDAGGTGSFIKPRPGTKTSSTGSAFDVLKTRLGQNEHKDTASLKKFLGHDPRGKDNAWCGSVINAALKEVGVTGTNSNLARSFLKWGKKVGKPQVGDIVVFWRGSKDSWKGHVGFYAGESKGQIKLLGGNQGDSVSYSNYPKSRVLGYRRQPGGSSGAVAGNIKTTDVDINKG